LLDGLSLTRLKDGSLYFVFGDGGWGKVVKFIKGGGFLEFPVEDVIDLRLFENIVGVLLIELVLELVLILN
jgi:hypothetical protein